jgi:hypothetical protein
LNITVGVETTLARTLAIVTGVPDVGTTQVSTLSFIPSMK